MKRCAILGPVASASGAVRLLALGLLLLAPPLYAADADHPNGARGFHADQVYSVGNLDSVNLFNGSLVITIPIGGKYPVGGAFSYGLTLTYNARPWKWLDFCTGEDGTDCHPYAVPDPCSNAGFGWRLSLGKLEGPPAGTINPSGLWVYTAPDGSQHRLYAQLHPTDPADGAYYASDGSYLRMKNLGGGVRTIEFPDGTVQTFSMLTTTDWRPTEMRDPFGNRVTVTYGANTWTLSDSQGRSQVVHFQSVTMDGDPFDAVDRVTLTAFGGTSAVYTFSYAEGVSIRKPTPNIANGSPRPSSYALVALLTGVELPDGSTYSMAPTDYLTDWSGGSRNSGLLARLRLPTLGQLEWAYGTYQFPHASGMTTGTRTPHPREYLEFVPGVVSRSRKNASGAYLGTWTYLPHLVTETSGDPVELTNTETTPLGHRIVHYFSVFPDNTSPTTPVADDLDYGLPFTPKSPDPASPGRYLSVETWQNYGTVGQPNLVLVRQSYARYERDALPSQPEELQAYLGGDLNRRLASSRTVYHEDAGNPSAVHSVDETSSNWDGVGHFRQRTTGGDFGAGNVRTTFTDYFGKPDHMAPWVLGLYDDQTETEGMTQKQESCFETGTGFLLRKRLLRSGTAEGANDVILTYGHDASGNLTHEAAYGGDGPLTVPTGSLCSLNLGTSAAQFPVDHSYAYGARRSSRYSSMPFYSLDLTIDANTGLASASRDTAAVETTFTYDAMGRLTSERPAAAAWTTYTYTPASSSSSLAQVDIFKRPNGSPGGTPLARSEVLYDALGRVWREKQLLPDGTWNRKETLYDGEGDLASVSTTEADSGSSPHKTIYDNYDPFGRAGAITPPEGAGHKMQIFYGGVRSITHQYKVRTAAAAAAEETVQRVEIYDRQGRLYKVREPSGAGGDKEATTYSYDVGNHLSRVETTDDAAGVTQVRTFTYDGRGFLLAESHPEKVGAVTHGSYDAHGHARSRTDGGRTISFNYDAAERLTDVFDGGFGGRVLKHFDYGTSNSGADKRLGKLTSALRKNYVLFGSEQTIDVADSYAYTGLDGRLSSRTTSQSLNGVLNASFQSTYAYDPLGNVASIGYPQCAQGSGLLCTDPSPRTVSFIHANGYLTSVPGYATSITYHPNGMVSQVFHANGVADAQGNDPYGIRRPASIATSGALPTGSNWSSGAYAYDGAANITDIGNAHFLYDQVSRLSSATLPLAPGGGSSPSTSRSYAYDTFGNLQAIGGDGGRATPTSPSTNRLSSPGTVYDPAGNLTTASGGARYEYGPFHELWHYCSTSGCYQTGEEWIYLYDADDERFWSFKVAGSFSRYSLRGPDHQVLRDYEVAGTTYTAAKDYVYRDGQLLASVAPAPLGVRHYSLDHLGSPRLVTDAARNVTAYHVYYPYGEEATAFNQDTERMKLTGHERDLASPTGPADDLDYMHARFCSPVVGRFLSVDVGNAKPGAPQTWNRYTYTGGNPLTNVDRDGKESSASIALEHDIQDYAAGKITEQEYFERINARGAGAAIGAASVLGAFAGPEILSALSGAATNLTSLFLDPRVQTAATSLAAAFADQPGPGSFSQVEEALRPGGVLVGEASSSSAIRVFGGGVEEAKSFFLRLAAGGQVIKQTDELVAVELKGVGKVTFRTAMNSRGFAATIDVRIPGIGIREVKFLAK